MKPGQVVAVVTAAGFSSRMGFSKALLEWHGKPLVAHQVETLAALGEVIVVLGHEAERIRPHVPASARVVVNPDYASGRVGSLLAGFRAIAGTPAGVLVVGVDQPLVADVVARLLDAATEKDAIVLPVHAGKR
ncbi:MAG TPA: NTP transferase domain-containing protein, partial [Oscillatoriaceae cyanobacterium]